MGKDELYEKNLVRARNVAYRYLTYRPRSRKEVEDKLRDREFEPSVICTVLSNLERFGYVDDREFSSAWARSRVRIRGFGRRRIAQELRSKGISREIIEETLEAVFEDSSEADIALREAEKKLKSLARCEYDARRRRLAGFLERKGFSSEIIRAILHGVR